MDFYNYSDNDTFESISLALDDLFKSNTYDDIKSSVSLVSLPRLKRGSSDEEKASKKKLSDYLSF